MLDREQSACRSWLSAPENRGGNQSLPAQQLVKVNSQIIPVNSSLYKMIMRHCGSEQWALLSSLGASDLSVRCSGIKGAWEFSQKKKVDGTPAFLCSYPPLGNQLWHCNMMVFYTENLLFHSVNFSSIHNYCLFTSACRILSVEKPRLHQQSYFRLSSTQQSTLKKKKKPKPHNLKQRY